MAINFNHTTESLSTGTGIFLQNDAGGFKIASGDDVITKPTPTGNNGLIRYNTTNSALEVVMNGAYKTITALGNSYTGSGNIVLATSPTISSPVLSTPAITGGTISGSYTGITGVGTLTAGTWNGNLITGQYGGTGVANTGKTITLGGNLTTSGAYNTTLTVSGTTNLILPTSGTITALGNSSTGSGNIVLATSPTVTSPTVTGGTINNTVIGGSTPAAGSFTTGYFSSTVGIGTISPSCALDLSGTDTAVRVSSGTTAQRPGTPLVGMIRYNSTLALGYLEGYQQSMWMTVGSRTRLSGNTTYYVATTGSDTTGDGSASLPWATIQKAIDYLYSFIDASGYDVTISVADGTYTRAVVVYPVLNVKTFTIIGNKTTPTNVIINTGTSNGFDVRPYASVCIEGFYISSSNTSISIDHNARAITSYVNFGTAVYYHVYVYSSSYYSSDYEIISGSAAMHWFVDQNSSLYTAGGALTLTGTPAFSNSFVYTRYGGMVLAWAMTISGSATGVRYYASTNSVIQGDGTSTYFPGNVSGSTSSGGQYV